MVMNRRGQVFLMAAVIIAGLLFALTRINNSGVSREKPEAFYDLADEIGFETKRVLDYGVINGQPSSTLAGQLLLNYTEYIANDDVVFIYGDASGVYAVYFQTVNLLGIQILNDTFYSIPVITQNSAPVEVKKDSSANTATVRILGNDYNFDLKAGQNFYFVLIKEEEGEQFVAVE